MDHAWGSADEWAAVKKVAVDKVSVVLGVFKVHAVLHASVFRQVGRLVGVLGCIR